MVEADSALDAVSGGPRVPGLVPGMPCVDGRGPHRLFGPLMSGAPADRLGAETPMLVRSVVSFANAADDEDDCLSGP